MKIVSANIAFSHIWYIFYGGTKSNIFLCTLPNIYKKPDTYSQVFTTYIKKKKFRKKIQI